MNQFRFAEPPPGQPEHHDTDSLVVDCDSCVVRSPGACADCVVSVLLGPPQDAPVDLDDEERAALDALAGSGLVPPLRLVTVEPSPMRHPDSA